jgi:hypothetical protein
VTADFDLKVGHFERVRRGGWKYAEKSALNPAALGTWSVSRIVRPFIEAQNPSALQVCND